MTFAVFDPMRRFSQALTTEVYTGSDLRFYTFQFVSLLRVCMNRAPCTSLQFIYTPKTISLFTHAQINLQTEVSIIRQILHMLNFFDTKQSCYSTARFCWTEHKSVCIQRCMWFRFVIPPTHFLYNLCEDILSIVIYTSIVFEVFFVHSRIWDCSRALSTSVDNDQLYVLKTPEVHIWIHLIWIDSF